jgi:hypothetical protein
MLTRTRKRADQVPLRDKALRESDAKFRTLAETATSATFTCWGERLLLRIADRELCRMKGRGEEKPFLSVAI